MACKQIAQLSKILHLISSNPAVPSQGVDDTTVLSPSLSKSIETNASTGHVDSDSFDAFDAFCVAEGVGSGALYHLDL